MEAGRRRKKRLPAPAGRYEGTAVFRWDNQEDLKDGKSVVIAFSITVQAD